MESTDPHDDTSGANAHENTNTNLATVTADNTVPTETQGPIADTEQATPLTENIENVEHPPTAGMFPPSLNACRTQVSQPMLTLSDVQVTQCLQFTGWCVPLD